MLTKNGRLAFALTFLTTLLAGCNEGQNLGGAPGAAPPAAGGGGGVTPTAFSVSGIISTPFNSAFDRDTNDPNSPTALNPAVHNNDIANAQLIPNPSVVGGHVNLAGQGSAGATSVAGDTEDFYSVDLLAGQVISVTVSGDASAGDIELFLLDPGGNLRDAVVTPGGFKRLVVTTGGSSRILIRAVSGAANYVLNIGLERVAADAIPPRPEWESGELIVKLGNSGPLKGLPQAGAALAMLPQSTPGRAFVYRFDNAAAAQMAALGPASGLPRTGIDPRMDTLRVRRTLMNTPGVEYAELNYRRYATAVPNDPLFPLQWHYSQINLPAALDIPRTGSAIVAVIDTGIVSGHPDFQNQLVPGFDFISDPVNAVDGDGIDANPEDPGDGQLFGVPSSWHGTHVAGTVAAATNNALLVAGVAPDTRIMPLRVLGALGGTDADIGQAMLFAAGLANDSGTLPAQRADVINLSLGGPGVSAFVQDVVTQARAAGVILVAAAGNNNSDIPSFPASVSGVISVSATQVDETRAPYSNFGPTIDVAAPGGNTNVDINGDGFGDGVLSTYIDESTNPFTFVADFLQGTSMASPHVAGVIALMKTINPALTPTQVDDLILAGSLTRDLGAIGRDDIFGHGLIDAVKAANAAEASLGGGVTPIAILTANPDALNFGTDAIQNVLTLSNPGSGALTVTAIDSAQSFISVAPQSVDANGLGTYLVTVNRTGLADGTHGGTVEVTSSAGNLSIPVILQQFAAGGFDGDLGFHYVLLIDVNSLATIAQEEVAVNQGRYTFNFASVPSGTFLLVAGTDSDNDGFICDEGEACGAFPVLDNPQQLSVQQNLSNLNFDSSLSGGISGAGSGGATTGFRRLQN